MGINVYNEPRQGPLRRGGKVKGWIKGQTGTIRAGFSQSLAAHVGNVIVSLEGLSWIFDREVVRQFHDELAADFDVIKIIVYLRRQDKQAVSHHQQGSKPSGEKAAEFYGNRPTALPDYSPHLQNYLNYNQRIGHWADAFGDANICLRIFERHHLKDGDVVSDFIATTGIPIQPDFIIKNESDGLLKTKVGHLMHQKKINKGLRYRFLEKLTAGEKMLPSAQDAAAFYANFRESNKSLNERFKISPYQYLFDDDFSAYPPQRNDLWTENSANEAIMALLTTIKEMPIISTEDALRLMALSKKIEVSNPDLGRRLRRVFPGHDPQPKHRRI